MNEEYIAAHACSGYRGSQGMLTVLQPIDNECLGEQVRVYEDRQIGDQH